MYFYWTSYLPTLILFKGINSPQALKKILSLSEEGSLDRHKKQSEDTVSSASSQLSSPPTSPQSSPRKGIKHSIFLILFPVEAHRLWKLLRKHLDAQDKLLLPLLFLSHVFSDSTERLVQSGIRERIRRNLISGIPESSLVNKSHESLI